MELKRLRRRCEEKLRGLALPAPFDLRAFCDLLAARRGRPLLLHPVACEFGVWGLWIATDEADFVFYERETTRLHQEHIILHELSHILCEHHSAPLADTELAQVLFPDLHIDLVRSILRRTIYSAEEEQEAELLASLILRQAGQSRPATSDAADPQVGTLLRNLGSALEDPG